MNLQEIKQSRTCFMGKEIEFYEEIDSTNIRAKNWSKEGAIEGSLVIAEKQNAGRGRMGKQWDSPKGEGIWMSLIVKPVMSIEKIPQLTILAGLSMCYSIRQATGLDIYIKWPNDLVVNNKKVCGILCEMVKVKDELVVVVGIGVNVNSKKFPDDLSHATSLYLEGKKLFSRESIIKSFLRRFEENYKIYIETGSLMNFIGDYKNYCINLNKQVKIIEGQQEFIGFVRDIDQEARLIVEKEDGSLISILSGDVSVRGLYGYV